jgi:hypothetical protein
MLRVHGNSIRLGTVSGRGLPLELRTETRDKHLYLSGSTGTGKSKLLEHLIRLDIIAWRKSKCSMRCLYSHVFIP